MKTELERLNYRKRCRLVVTSILLVETLVQRDMLWSVAQLATPPNNLQRRAATVADSYETVEEFLQMMDAGELDGNLSVETQKLTTAQLEQVGQILLDREEARRRNE